MIKLKVIHRIYMLYLIMVCAFSVPCFAHESFILITSLYNETNPKRIQEYLICLEKNLQHPYIEKIHVVYDTSVDFKKESVIFKVLQEEQSKDIDNPKVIITCCSGRPTYDFCFTLANELYPGRKIILSNADIYFNETLALLDDYNLENKFLALTRWNVLPNGSLIPYKRGNFKAIDSQDTWIFQTPIQVFSKKLALGTGCCDCRIAYEAEYAGYEVINPCLSIQCCHVHNSFVRHYDMRRVNRGHYKHVEWTALQEQTKN